MGLGDIERLFEADSLVWEHRTALGDAYIYAVYFLMWNIIVVKLLDHEEKPLLIISTRLRSFYFFPVILLKRPHWHFIQSQQSLVWIFDQNVLAVFHVPTHIDNGPDDAPAVSEVEIHLLGELARIVADNAENDMSIGDFGGSSGHESVIKVRGLC